MVVTVIMLVVPATMPVMGVADAESQGFPSFVVVLIWVISSDAPVLFVMVTILVAEPPPGTLTVRLEGVSGVADVTV